MKWNLKSLKQRILRQGAQAPTNELDPDMLKEMARGIVTARPDEIGCAECFNKMDEFVELTLAGKNAVQAMPLVEDHLNRCGDCREEFEALLAAVRAIA
jgi:bacterioferritin-associated ferredoxin